MMFNLTKTFGKYLPWIRQIWEHFQKRIYRQAIQPVLQGQQQYEVVCEAEAAHGGVELEAVDVENRCFGQKEEQGLGKLQDCIV